MASVRYSHEQRFDIRVPDTASHAAEEWLQLSCLDFFAPPIYQPWHLFFELEATSKEEVVDACKRGLEATLAESRWLAGVIKPDADGNYAIHTTKDSTAALTVWHLDNLGADYPSFDDLKRSNFSVRRFGPYNMFVSKALTYDPLPLLSSSPSAFALQLNFIRGGLVMVFQTYHPTVDMTGVASVVRQLAAHTREAISGKPDPLRTWDPAINKRSLLRSAPAEGATPIHAPPAYPANKEHQACSTIVLHLPKSKAAQLKAAVSPGDGSIVSSWDAFIALLWRLSLKHRQKVYQRDLDQPAFFVEAVDMRSRLTGNLKLHPQYQGNAWITVSSPGIEDGPTLRDVISAAPLSRIAAFVRKVGNTATQAKTQGHLDVIGRVQNKEALTINPQGAAPMFFVVTDWRQADLRDADFGFAKPQALRHPNLSAPPAWTMVHPPRAGGEDEGCEFFLPMEPELVDGFASDPALLEYFEYRGIDTELSSLRIRYGWPMFGRRWVNTGMATCFIGSLPCDRERHLESTG